MKKPGVKDRIIETASRLFYLNGYNQTGINQIIDEAGVAKASMYQHFRSKEEIAVSYLERRHRLWTDSLMKRISAVDAPQDKIMATFDYLEQWLKEVDYRGCGWQNIITDLPVDQTRIREQAVFHKNEVKEVIIDILQQAYTTEKATVLGKQLMVLMEGAIILSQIQKNPWPIQSAKEAGASLLEI
ncbi:TetR/AcrR family transcriptional regulator [Poritiphilus flavus]|uniref:TetR family transcriptional regulator n=1 Tax=Poritiphilus flavus TaxID=2697053 RepID=A0A6L9E9J9_9FLAO|nr:TetR/AcrR family transcriptional regulator [Poritiphilus flavus]NAS11314.1 TetR family transcriptional regulator [Poritiphilus flavus]